MLKSFTCIRCPNGCEVTVDLETKETKGNLCPRGREYALEELVEPKRTISSSVLVVGGVLPLVSVRLTNPIPKDHIFQAMEEIRKLQVHAPVKAGTVLISRLLGFESDVVATKNVGKV